MVQTNGGAAIAVTGEPALRIDDLRAALFRGWFDSSRRNDDSDSSCSVRQDDSANASVLEARGLRIVVDRRHVDYAIGRSSLTLCLGEPRIDDSGLQRPAHKIAEKIRRGSSAELRLRGRFAVVHVDFPSRSIMFITDRFAVHPVCYAQEGALISFSDRADSVPAEGPREIDPQAIYNYAYFHVIPAPRTIFRGVLRLEPAQLVRIDASGAQSSFWWQPRFSAVQTAPFGELKTRFRELVRRAVARQLTTERVGTFLSGGTDSSTVAGFLAQLVGGRVPTFSIGFDAAGYDEMAYARIAARHYNTDQHEYYITPEDLARSIPEVAAYYDQPFGNSSALPAYYCSLQAKQAGVEKMLAGDGGDELFGGNTRYAKQKVFDAYYVVPALLRTAVLEPVFVRSSWSRKIPLLRKATSYIEQARLAMPDRMESYNLLDRFGSSAVFSEAFLSSVEAGEPKALQRAVYGRTVTPSIVDRMLTYDWRFTLADNDLPKVLGTAHLAGQAVGFPLLDDDLVDFSLELGPTMKVRGLTLRYFFKEALRGFLPDQIIMKKKHGFGLPFGPWLSRSEPLQLLARHAVEQLSARGLLRRQFGDELFRTHLTDHAAYFGEMIWILVMLEKWLSVKAPNYAFPSGA